MREITERARYLRRTTELDRTDAWIVAYREVGYSSAGVAKQPKVDLSEDAVAAHVERIALRYGYPAVWGKQPDDRGDLEALTRADMPDHIFNEWLELADAHPNHVPDDLQPVATDPGTVRE